MVLTAVARAFKTPDLRKKILFTLFVILVFRIGSLLPTPGVDVGAVKAALWLKDKPAGLYAMADVLGL